jgi:hypothetical protein
MARLSFLGQFERYMSAFPCNIGRRGATMRNYLFAGLLLLFAADAAHAQTMIYIPVPAEVPDARVEDYSALHTVAVVSSIGQTLSVVTNNFFGNNTHEIDVTAWGINEDVISTVKELLSDRFQFVDVAYDPHELAALRMGGMMETRLLRTYLESLPAEGVDGFIVVRGYVDYDISGTRIGLSLTQTNGSPIERANYEISVVDMVNEEEVGSAHSRLLDRPGQEPSFVSIYGSRFVAPGDDGALSAEQMAVLKEDFSILVARSLLETLRVLEFGVELPPIGARSLLPLAQEDNPYSGIQTVSVVSALGDEIGIRAIGASVDEDSLPTPDSTIDDMLEARLTSELGDRFSFVESNVDRGALFDARIFEGNSLRDQITELPRNPDIDAYLLLLKHPNALFDRGNSYLGGTGLGVWHRRDLRGGETQVYATYAMVLVDAETLEIKDVTISGNSPALPEAHALGIDNDLWVEEAAEVTPEHRESYFASIQELLDNNLTDTILRSGITGYRISPMPPTQISEMAPQ